VRVLVVGSYPPPAHGESHRTVATVHRLGACGDDVDVLSRRGSAARLRGPIAGPAGAFTLWWRSRGYDAVVVHVESGAPLRVSHGRRARVDRLVDCLAWGLALRMVRDVTLVVPDTDVVPRSVGGRSGRFLWTAADHLLVSSERGRRRLVDEGGASEDKVELPDVVASPARADDGWHDIDDAADVMERVQQRAAEDRRAARRGTLDAGVARRKSGGPGARSA
jgi:hypothetical protein